jgi:transposase InsO family protein
MTRAAFYKGRKARSRREVDEEAVVALVKRERALQPRLGARKVLWRLRRELEEMGIRMGRDRLLEVLRRHDMLIQRPRRGVRTTDSRHGLRTYPNRLREMELTGAHQAWASDVTYVRTEEGFVYCSLIHDVYSRKVVGYAGADTLEATGSLEALEMALGQLPAKARPLHHSDRGIQYACGDYVKRLEADGLTISMTQENHCYENAQAERLNGILKEEYNLGETFRTRAQARAALMQAVSLYNEMRPHTSLGYRTPAEAHREAHEEAA